MYIKYLALILNLVVFISTVAQESESQNKYYSRYKGNLDSLYVVTANLLRLNDNISGIYRFSHDNNDNSRDRNIPVTGKFVDDIASIKAIGSDKYLFIGRMDKKFMEGKLAIDIKDERDIRLNEYYPDGSIQFDVHYLRSEERLFKDSINSPVAEIELTLLYPVDSDIAITDSVKDHINNSFFGRHTWQMNADTLLTQFEDEYYNQYRDQNTDRYSLGASFNWQKIVNMTVLNNCHDIISVEFLKYAYTGGAHGITNISYCNIDLQTGSNFSYDDVFTDNSDSSMCILLKRALYLQRKIPHDVSIKDAGYFVDIIEPNQNFYINTDGIGFTYNSYEIAPYAMGQTNLFLEFEDIIDLLREDTPVYSIAKKRVSGN